MTADFIANNADTCAASARALVDVEAVAAADDRRAIQVRVLVGGCLDGSAVEAVFDPKPVSPAARRERQRPDQRQPDCPFHSEDPPIGWCYVGLKNATVRPNRRLR
jgi:hypothetical protein